MEVETKAPRYRRCCIPKGNSTSTKHTKELAKESPYPHEWCKRARFRKRSGFLERIKVSNFRISEANSEITKEISIEGIKSTAMWTLRALAKRTEGETCLRRNVSTSLLCARFLRELSRFKKRNLPNTFTASGLGRVYFLSRGASREIHLSY